MNAPCLYPPKCPTSVLKVAAGAFAGVVAAMVVVFPCSARAQEPVQSAQQVVRDAVQSELRAAQVDKSLWRYRDEDDDATRRATYRAVETPQGELRRLIALNGQPLQGAAEQKELQRIESYVRDQTAQARSKKNDAHDDAQAEAFLKMLPQAFVWTLQGQTPETITLRYAPNPNFQPPTLESRVLAVMEGEMVVARQGDRIQSLRGRLSRDVKFGFGLLGKMDAGGTFNVERRQVAPGHWEITENHVHIGGHVLLFKNIGQESDEVKTDWSPSNAQTLQAAAQDLGVGVNVAQR